MHKAIQQSRDSCPCNAFYSKWIALHSYEAKFYPIEDKILILSLCLHAQNTDEMEELRSLPCSAVNGNISDQNPPSVFFFLELQNYLFPILWEPELETSFFFYLTYGIYKAVFAKKSAFCLIHSRCLINISPSFPQTLSDILLIWHRVCNDELVLWLQLCRVYEANWHYNNVWNICLKTTAIFKYTSITP